MSVENNMSERDDVSVENTTCSNEMMCLSKCIENARTLFCFDFPNPMANRRLGSIKFTLPNEDFGRPDEPFVDLSECVFEALFNGVSTGFGLRNAT